MINYIKIYFLFYIPFEYAFPQSALDLCPSNEELKGLKISLLDSYEKYILFPNCHNLLSKEINIIEPYDIGIRRIQMEYSVDEPNSKGIQLKIKEELLQDYGRIYISQKENKLTPNSSMEIFIRYECPLTEEGNTNKPSNFKGKLGFFLKKEESEEELIFSFSLTKICLSQKEIEDLSAIDLSYIFIVIFPFIIIGLSILKQESADMENIIIQKYPEIRNSENAFISYLILIIIFLFVISLDILGFYIKFCIFISYAISNAICLEFILNYLNLTVYVPQYLIKTEVNFGFLRCNILLLLLSVIGLLFVLFIQFYNSIFIFNYLVCVFSITVLRVYKITSFRFLLIFCLFVWIFNFIYFLQSSNKFFLLIEKFSYKENLPLYLKFPEINFDLGESFLYLSLPEIIFPGLILNFFFRYDKKMEFKGRKYFLYSGIGYLISLIMKIIFESYFYLQMNVLILGLPLIIFPSLILGYLNGDLKDILEGFKATVFEENEISSQRLNQIASFEFKQSFDSNRSNEE
ncbi:MAG: A22B family peptidase [archaeon]|nr:A22B family peptidase [archaeon]